MHIIRLTSSVATTNCIFIVLAFLPILVRSEFQLIQLLLHKAKQNNLDMCGLKHSISNFTRVKPSPAMNTVTIVYLSSIAHVLLPQENYFFRVNLTPICSLRRYSIALSNAVRALLDWLTFNAHTHTRIAPRRNVCGMFSVLFASCL